jgi:chaperonin GroEL
MKTFSKEEELVSRILKGVDALTDYVASTMGPRGRNVILQQKGKNPIVTKDGVTVARFFDAEEPIANAAVQIVKQAAEYTNDVAGDGTTTSTVLARAIYKEALKHVAAGVSPIEIKRGIDKAVEKVCDLLHDQATDIQKIDDVENVATISANGDATVGKIVARAVNDIGKDGSITISEGRSLDTTLEFVEGYRFNSGVASRSFLTDIRTNTMQHTKPFFLITDEVIDDLNQILPALTLAARAKRPLIVVAEEVTDGALAAMVLNATRGSMKVAAIKPPYYGEERKQVLEDLAVSVGATFFSRAAVEPKELQAVELKDLGQSKKIEATKSQTTIVGGSGEGTAIDERVEGLKAELDQTEDMRECERIQARISRLSSSVAVIHVGGATEVEMIERKHRIEDALEAVRSAQAEGIVAGGGTALLLASKDLEVETDNTEQQSGVAVVKIACQAPLTQMVRNAGDSADVVVSKVLDLEEGYNIVTREYGNMCADGVIDPVKVTKSALQNAASVAGTLITTNFAIVES